MAAESHSFQHPIPGRRGREEHTPGCVTPGFVKLACRAPASSQQFPEREKLPAGIGLALQLWLTGVQIPSSLGAHRTSAVGSRARGQSLLEESGIPSFAALLLLWAQPVPMIPGELAMVKSKVRATRQLPFWSQL